MLESSISRRLNLRDGQLRWAGGGERGSWGDASLGCLGLSLEVVHRVGKLHPQDGLYTTQPRLLESLAGKEIVQVRELANPVMQMIQATFSVDH